jgi:hypothetical protein
MFTDFTPHQWLFIGPVTFGLAVFTTIAWSYHG